MRTRFAKFVCLGAVAALAWLAGCGPKDEQEAPDPGPRTTIDREDSRVRMGLALLQEGHVDGAMEQFHRLALEPEHRVTPDHQPAWFEDLVRQLIRRRQSALADSLLGATGPLAERPPRLRYLSANLLVIEGRNAEAVSAYESIGNEDKDLYLRSLHELASLQLLRGETEAALARAREGLNVDPESSQLRLLLAEGLKRQGHPRQALDELAKIPGSTSRWVTEGAIRLDALDTPDSAVIALERAYQAAPQIPDVRYQLGRAYVGVERPRPAVLLLEPLARRDDPFERSRPLLSAAYRQLGRVASADSLDAVERAYQARQQTNALRTAGLQASVAGQLDEALRLFDQALRREPDYADLHNDRGAVLARLERWKQAERAFRRAEELAPDDPTVQQNLARLYERTGDGAARDRAVARYQELTAGPR